GWVRRKGGEQSLAWGGGGGGAPPPPHNPPTGGGGGRALGPLHTSPVVSSTTYRQSHAAGGCQSSSRQTRKVLALDAGERHALDEGALGQEENDDRRQRDQHGGGHQQPPLAAVLAAVLLQPQLKGIQVLVVEIDQRIEIVGPGANKLEHRDCCERRLRQR